MTLPRPADLSASLHPDAPSPIETPDWGPDRREPEPGRRTDDRFRQWVADNALKLIGLVVSGIFVLLATLGLRMEGAPQDLARFRVQSAIDQTAIIGRVVKVEDVTAQLLNDNRDLKSAVKEQHYLLCYIIRKQDPATAGAIESCSGVQAPGVRAP